MSNQGSAAVVLSVFKSEVQMFLNEICRNDSNSEYIIANFDFSLEKQFKYDLMNTQPVRARSKPVWIAANFKPLHLKKKKKSL